MTRMDATTYAESVISTPNIGCSAFEVAHDERDDVHRAAAHATRGTGRVMIAFISSGSIQLLVGPASFSSREQM